MRGVVGLVLLGVGCSGIASSGSPADAATATPDVAATRNPARAARAECETDRDCASGLACRTEGSGEFTRRSCVAAPPFEPREPTFADGGWLGALDGSPPSSPGEPTTDEVTPPRTRSVVLVPDASQIAPSVKLVLVIDNSASMSEEQERMALGVRRMIASLRDRPALDVQVYLYTTSSYVGASAGRTWTERHFTTWADGSVHADGFLPQDGTAFEDTYEWELAPPLHAAIPFRSSMSDADFAASLGALEAAVRSVGTHGSESESAFCTMAQTIVGGSENAFLVRGEPAAFVLLTDSDDAGLTASCMQQAVLRREPQRLSTRIATDDPARADVATWTLDELAFASRHTYQVIDAETGLPQTIAVSDEAAFDPASFGLPNACPATATTCPDALRAHVVARAGGRPVLECTYACRGFEARRLEASTHDLTRDYCRSPYAIGPTTFANVYADARARGFFPVPERCRASYYMPVTVVAYGAPQTVSSVSFSELLPATSPLEASLETRLGEALPLHFGASNYFVSAIVDDARFPECADSEATATRYGAFVDALGSNGFVQSICDDDYRASLDGLAEFITRPMQQTFEVPLAEGERIVRVVIERDGADVEVTSLAIEGGHIELFEPLEVDDRVRVEIAQ